MFRASDWISMLKNSEERTAMPIMTYPGLKLSGKSLLEVVNDGRAQFNTIMALVGEFPSAGAVTIMDLSVEAEAFGSPIKFSEQDVPVVTDRIVSDYKSITELKVPEVGTGRTGVYLKAAQLASGSIKDRPVFGGLIGPYSLAGRLFDMTEIMMAIILEPETIHLLLDKCTSFLTAYAKEFKETGASGVIIAEPAAGLLSLNHCQDFSSQYVRRIVEAVQDDDFMVILHNCGNTKHLIPSLLSTGAKGFHFGNAVDMSEIMPLIPQDRMAFGNIDPAGTFKAGTAAEVREKTLALLDKTSEFKNFVLSSGCDVPPGTPIENVEAFYNALEEYNQAKCKIGV